MNKFITKHPPAWIGILVLSSLLIITGCGSGASSDKSDSTDLLLLLGLNQGQHLTVLTTNDRHSNFLGKPYGAYNPAVKGDATAGGASRMAALFGEYRASNSDTLVFDAGDFVDGTIFIAAENGSADLNMLSYLGYDAAGLGNHEMGMGPEGLAQMISGATGTRTPLLCANINFSSANTTLGHSDDALEAMYGNEGTAGKYIYPYIIRTTPSGYRVGVFGLMGEDVFMPDARPCTFTIDYAAIQALIDSLRNDADKKADVVICLMHAGFSASGGTPSGEIADLAKNVSGIDMICAGHSHTKATAKVPCEVPSTEWTTTILEAGDETKNVGMISLDMGGVLEGRTVNPAASAAQVPVDDSIIGTAAINTRIADFITDIETNYLTNFTQLKDGGLFDVLAHSSFTFGQLNSMNMVSDAMRSASGADAALCTPGADTASVAPDAAGNITVYDAFTAMPHGMGRDSLHVGKENLHGGPLYKFNLLAAELEGILELATCNLGQSTPDLFVLPSGVKIIYNTADLQAGTGPGYIIKMYLVPDETLPPTLIFDRTDAVNFPYGGWKYEAGTNGGPGDPYQPLSICTTTLSLIGLKEVGAAYDLWPRNAVMAQVEWSHISELDSMVVQDGGNEVKAWYSVAEFIASFAGGNVPSCYDDTYTDGSTHNPIGPSWRRVWDVATYGAP